MATDLREFLLARIQEDELTAQAAIDRDPSWGAYYAGGAYREVHDADGAVIAPAVDALPTPETAAHVARHDPARVLADCGAKRRIVERCGAVDYAMPSTHLAHSILSELALAYVDHPDYRDEWRP